MDIGVVATETAVVITVAIGGVVVGAINHRVTTGSWKNSATVARNDAASGFKSGAIKCMEIHIFAMI